MVSVQFNTKPTPTRDHHGNSHHTMVGEARKILSVHAWACCRNPRAETSLNSWRRIVEVWTVMFYGSWPEWIQPSLSTWKDDSSYLTSCLMTLYWYLNHQLETLVRSKLLLICTDLHLS